VRFNDHICWLARTGTATDWLSLSKIFSLLIVGCLLVRAVPVNPGENVGNGSSSAGRRMFFGETPLLGTIVGHHARCSPKWSAALTATGKALGQSRPVPSRRGWIEQG